VSAAAALLRESGAECREYEYSEEADGWFHSF
jgi:hypothetical protein